MPKIDLRALTVQAGSGYPTPHDQPVAGRSWVKVASGLTQFGANLVTLEPGAWSSQRHWHSAEDEMVIIVSGEAVLVDDAGETPLRPGDVACFPAGTPNAHHLRNRSSAPAVFLAIGTDDPARDECRYPDIDMFWSDGTGYVVRDGNATP